MLSPDVLFAFFAASLLLTGLCVHTIAVALGVAVLLQSSPVAFAVLKAAGAAYLLYLARLSFRAGALPAGGGSAPFPGYGALYRRGIVMNITNPKVTLFFLPFCRNSAIRRAAVWRCRCFVWAVCLLRPLF